MGSVCQPTARVDRRVRAARLGEVIPFDAIVLTGGRSSRLGGTAKAGLMVGGRPLVDHAVAAVADARTVTVVGPEIGGGPAAALASALPQGSAPVVVVLACDMPLLGPETVRRLVAAADLGCASGDPGTDGAWLVDQAGHSQYLAAAYRRAALARRVAGLDRVDGTSMRRLVEGLRMHDVAAQAEEALDCDTWADVERARTLLEDT